MTRRGWGGGEGEEDEEEGRPREDFLDWKQDRQKEGREGGRGEGLEPTELERGSGERVEFTKARREVQRALERKEPEREDVNLIE